MDEQSKRRLRFRWAAAWMLVAPVVFAAWVALKHTYHVALPLSGLGLVGVGVAVFLLENLRSAVRPLRVVVVAAAVVLAYGWVGYDEQHSAEPPSGGRLVAWAVALLVPMLLLLRLTRVEHVEQEAWEAQRR